MLITIAAIMVIIILLISFWEIWKALGLLLGAILYMLFTLGAFAIAGYAIYILVTTETVFMGVWGMFIPFVISVVLANALEWWGKVRYVN